MHILKRTALGLLVVLAAALLAGYLADPVITTRVLALAVGGSTGPTARVPGGAVPDLVVADPAARTIPQPVLDQAVAYGAEQDSHALLIWQGGALQLEHYYPGHDATSITPTQSMHKSVLALVVGIAIDQGLIRSVDEPVSTYVPEWAGDGRRQITIRQMLQQSSGIDWPGGLPGLLRMTLGGNLEQLVLSQGVFAPAGSQFDYNGVNPQVLGIVIARVSGRPYADYLAENLWRQVSSDDAFVELDSDEHRTPRTFCCLGATARSWLRVGLLHLDHGRVGDRQVVPATWMREVVAPSAQNPNYGFLTWLGTRHDPERRYNRKASIFAPASEPFAANDVIYFDGFGGQRVYIVPSRQLVVVHTGPLKPDWDDAVLINLVIRGMAREQATPP